jgi:hypothetical protein
MGNYKQLANSTKCIIRVRAASDENCPIDILIKLCFDSVWLVRCSVMRNKSTPKKLIKAYYNYNFICGKFNQRSFDDGGYRIWYGGNIE